MLGIAIAQGSEDSILSLVLSFLRMPSRVQIDLKSTTRTLNDVACALLPRL